MNDKERLAYYESIRESPSGGVALHQKRVHAQHRELARQYSGKARVHDRHAKSFNLELERERQRLEGRLGQLKTEYDKCDVNKQKNHIFLKALEERHNSLERTRIEPAVMVEMNTELNDVEVIRAIGKFIMTKSMRKRMQSVPVP